MEYINLVSTRSVYAGIESTVLRTQIMIELCADVISVVYINIKSHAAEVLSQVISLIVWNEIFSGLSNVTAAFNLWRCLVSELLQGRLQVLYAPSNDYSALAWMRNSTASLLIASAWDVLLLTPCRLVTATLGGSQRIDAMLNEIAVFVGLYIHPFWIRSSGGARFIECLGDAISTTACFLVCPIPIILPIF